MPWFVVDDNFPDHPKVRAIPRAQRVAAAGLWTLAGAWASRHLRDGRIPGYMVVELGAQSRSAAALVAVDLWHTHGHSCSDCPDAEPDGYIFHDWSAFQPTRDEVEAKRERERQRKADWRRSQAEKREAERSSPANVPAVSHGTDAVVRAESALTHTQALTPTLTQAFSSTSSGCASLRNPALARCTKHTDWPDDKPVPDCGGCMRARQSAEAAAERAKADERDELAARRSVLAACPDCDEKGFQLDNDGKPTSRCDHRKATA